MFWIPEGYLFGQIFLVHQPNKSQEKSLHGHFDTDTQVSFVGAWRWFCQFTDAFFAACWNLKYRVNSAKVWQESALRIQKGTVTGSPGEGKNWLQLLTIWWMPVACWQQSRELRTYHKSVSVFTFRLNQFLLGCEGNGLEKWCSWFLSENSSSFCHVVWIMISFNEL